MAAAPTTSVPAIEVVPSGPARAAERSAPEAATVVAPKKKSNTTLSSAASESAPATVVRTGRRLALVGGGAAAAVLVVLALIRLASGGAASTTRTVAPAPAAAANPRPVEQVEVAINSDPPGAKLVRTDGVIVGVTPVTLRLDKGSPALEMQLDLDGYRSERRIITSELNRELDVNLVKAPARRAPATTPLATVVKPAAPKAGAARPVAASTAAPEPVEAKPVATPLAAPKPKPDQPVDPDKELIPAQF